MSELTKKNLIMVKNIITERATFFFDCITNKNHKYSYEMFRKRSSSQLGYNYFLFRKKDVPAKKISLVNKYNSSYDL